MLKLAEGALESKKSRDYLSARERKAHGEAQALAWLKEGLTAAGLDEKLLRQGKGSDARKVALARLLWERTTVSQGWIAQRLHMKSAANVSQVMSRGVGIRRVAGLPAGLVRWLHSVRI